MILCLNCNNRGYTRVKGDGKCDKHGRFVFYRGHLKEYCSLCAKEKQICQVCGKSLYTSEQYLEDSARTCAGDYDKIRSRMDNDTIDLLHAAMGACTEAGELVDVIKKYLFYGKEIDKVNLKEEYGDELWYIALGLRKLKTTFSECMKMNIDKLKLRYPENFTEDNAINRNIKAERDLLEDSK